MQGVSAFFKKGLPSVYRLAKRAAARLADTAATTADDCVSDACQRREAKADQNCFFHDNLNLTRLKIKSIWTFPAPGRKGQAANPCSGGWPGLSKDWEWSISVISDGRLFSAVATSRESCPIRLQKQQHVKQHWNGRQQLLALFSSAVPVGASSRLTVQIWLQTLLSNNCPSGCQTGCVASTENWTVNMKARYFIRKIMCNSLPFLSIKKWDRLILTEVFSARRTE